jgi:predicted kinase
LSQAFTSSPDIFAPAETLEFHALYEEALQRLKPLLNRRTLQGLVRRCHGDMHCGNIVIINDRPTLFDAIEFSDKIATIDVLYDLAFLLMDLVRHGRRDVANIILNRYLHLRREMEDLSGLAALPLFLATRAGVRALVAADLVHELAIGMSLKPRGDALDYFRASIAYLKPPPPLLVCFGGLSGTGKTVLSGAIAPGVGAAPGAVHIRSDIERKVLAGVAEEERLPDDAYAPQNAGEVYRVMFERAEHALRAGHAVVLDAVFARESERNAAERLAKQLHLGFKGYWLEASPEVLKARVSARRGDASDATAEVVAKQLHYDLGRIAWQRVDASGSIDETATAVRRTLLHPDAVPA